VRLSSRAGLPVQQPCHTLGCISIANLCAHGPGESCRSAYIQHHPWCASGERLASYCSIDACVRRSELQLMPSPRKASLGGQATAVSAPAGLPLPISVTGRGNSQTSDGLAGTAPPPLSAAEALAAALQFMSQHCNEVLLMITSRHDPQNLAGLSHAILWSRTCRQECGGCIGCTTSRAGAP